MLVNRLCPKFPGSGALLLILSNWSWSCSVGGCCRFWIWCFRLFYFCFKRPPEEPDYCFVLIIFKVLNFKLAIIDILFLAWVLIANVCLSLFMKAGIHAFALVELWYVLGFYFIILPFRALSNSLKLISSFPKLMLSSFEFLTTFGLCFFP